MDADAVNGSVCLEFEVVLMGTGNFLVNLQTEKTGKAIAVENAKWECTCEKEESMDSLKKGIMLLK